MLQPKIPSWRFHGSWTLWYLERNISYIGLIKEFSKKNTLSLQIKQPTISYLHLQPCGQLNTHIVTSRQFTLFKKILWATCPD